MTGLAVILFLIGLVGAAVSLILIIIKAVKKQPKKKTGLALAVCFALFVISIIIMPKQTETPTETETPIQTEAPTETEAPIQTETPAQTEIPTQTEVFSQEEPTQLIETVIYAEDDVVNQFITDYNAITQSQITDITKGNIRTKYFFKTYGFRIEIVNATEALAGYTEVSINGNMESHVPEMRDVFHDVVKVLAPDLNDEEIYTFFDERTVYGNCAHETPLGGLTCSVYLTGNFDGNGRIDIHN